MMKRITAFLLSLVIAIMMIIPPNIAHAYSLTDLMVDSASDWLAGFTGNNKGVWNIVDPLSGMLTGVDRPVSSSQPQKYYTTPTSSVQDKYGKSCNDIQEMLWSQRNLNWNNFPLDCKRGSCCYRQWKEVQMQDPRDFSKTITVTRREWVIDREPPVFTKARDYVEKWL